MNPADCERFKGGLYAAVAHRPVDWTLTTMKMADFKGTLGRDAMRRVEELIPDLIILDYRRPDIHGRELCRQLRANPETRQIPILVGTASPQDDPDSAYPDAVLTKPCLLPTLLAASRLLLSRVLPTAVSRPPTVPTA